MPWRYGIVKYRHQKDSNFRFYGIGELYFEEDPLKPFACSGEPVEAYAETEDGEGDESIKEEIQKCLRAMLKDCSRYPIFDVDGPYAESPWNR
jgi:hypothetical protein